MRQALAVVTVAVLTGLVLVGCSTGSGAGACELLSEEHDEVTAYILDPDNVGTDTWRNRLHVVEPQIRKVAREQDCAWVRGL